MKKRIAIITNASSASGVGARAYEIASRIGIHEEFETHVVTLDGDKRELTYFPPKPYQGVRLPAFSGILNSKSIYWIRLSRHLPKFDIYDLSNQTLSFIAKKRSSSIVTVHDLIELTDPQNKRAFLMNRYLLSGIKRADRIIAVSEYTKHIIIKHLGISGARIIVVPNGINKIYASLPHFQNTVAYKELLADYRISQDRVDPLLVYVGSEHPRKNIEVLFRTVALLKRQFPHVLLVKIGNPGIRSGRIRTLELIDELDIRQNVQLLGNIPSDRINELYNIADAMVFPSTNEGFGLPPLEAMAAGCPVICSAAASLPEVVGDGAIMHDASDAEGFAASVVHIFTNAAFRAELTSRGNKRAALFSWDTATRSMIEVYRSL